MLRVRQHRHALHLRQDLAQRKQILETGEASERGAGRVFNEAPRRFDFE